jgi:cysteine-rich repeat protein
MTNCTSARGKQDAHVRKCTRSLEVTRRDRAEWQVPCPRDGIVALLLGLLLAVPSTARAAVTRSCGPDAVANTTNVLCAAPSGPCDATTVNLSTNIDVTDAGCAFDLGGRALNVQKTLQMTGLGFIRVTNAGNITITATGRLEARGDFVEPSGFIIRGGLVSLTSAGTITMLDRAQIDVSGDAAGTIRLIATGTNGAGVGIDLQATSVLSGQGISSFTDTGDRFADGGTLEVTASAGSIVDNATINLSSANGALGGDVTMRAARDISVGELLDATGGASDGGSVDMLCGDNMVITKTITVDSRLGGGYGGTITLAAGVDAIGGVVTGGTLTVNGATLSLDGSDAETFGGDGGDLEVTSKGLLQFIGAHVAIRASGGTLFDGSGGTVFLSSGDNNPNVMGPLDGDMSVAGIATLKSGGTDGDGGSFDIAAGRNLTLTARIDVSGQSTGGDITGDAGGSVLLNGSITAPGTSPTGEGGFIDFSAGLASYAGLTVAQDIFAPGGTSNGGGQAISLAGCTLTVNNGVKVDGHAGVNAANHPGGATIELIARGLMQLQASSQYLANPGGIIKTTHPPTQIPVIGAGVVFNPARTDNPTLVGSYPNCPVCGDGIRQAGEGCDDGGLVAGDGCSSTCTIEAGWTCTGSPSVCTNCGDGIQQAGEGCDDGNLINGDGCDANCTPTGCGNGIVTAGEGCDDGNTIGGDCCSASCQFEISGSTCTSDGNVCTNDVCNGAGVCVHVANTDPCASDGNVCTNDVCSAGVCGHVANTAPCASDGNPCTDDVCGGGTCKHVNNTAPCSDGNACTQADTCSGGSCVGANPVVCTALDQCHVVGTCAPATGICSNPTKINGSACNDVNACTRTDTCQAGTCTGGNPVVCTALDQCHVVGTCAPATGTCSNPTKANGSGCNDANPCTQTDTCQAGVCSGANPVICAPLDQCHVAGTCTPATGVCTNPFQPNGTPCNDGNQCTITDMCTNGQCAGNTMTCGDGITQGACGEGCDDGNMVNGDGCDNNCTPTGCGNGIVTAAEQCDDHDLTGGDGCSATCTIEPGWNCTGSPSVCTEVCGDGIVTPGEQCDDGNTVSRDGCSSTCKLELCGAAPATGCRRPVFPNKAAITLKDQVFSDSDGLIWKWIKGKATSKSDFGNPLFATSYAICVYDDTGGTPRLKLSAIAPAGGFCSGSSCWREKTAGYSYSDKDLTPHGISKMVLKEGLIDGTAKITLKGKGGNLLMPNLLGLVQPVIVQLRNSNGLCWEAVYSAPANKQTSDQFKDKAD